MEVLTPKQAAEFLRISESTLAKMRLRSGGPRYLKYGRSVRYEVSELSDWARSRLRLHTSHEA